MMAIMVVMMMARHLWQECDVDHVDVVEEELVKVNAKVSSGGKSIPLMNEHEIGKCCQLFKISYTSIPFLLTHKSQAATPV